MKNRKSTVYLLLAGVCLLIMSVAIAYIIKYYTDNRREEAMYESLQATVWKIPADQRGMRLCHPRYMPKAWPRGWRIS